MTEKAGGLKARRPLVFFARTESPTFRLGDVRTPTTMSRTVDIWGQWTRRPLSAVRYGLQMSKSLVGVGSQLPSPSSSFFGRRLVLRSESREDGDTYLRRFGSSPENCQIITP